MVITTSNLTSTAIAGLLLSCLLIFIMACFYEWIKWFRVYLQLSAAQCPPSCRHTNDEGKEDEVKQDDKRTDCNRSSVSAPLTVTLPPGYQHVSNRLSSTFLRICSSISDRLPFRLLRNTYWNGNYKGLVFVKITAVFVNGFLSSF